MVIEIRVPGEPVAQPRQKFRVVSARVPWVRPYGDPKHPVHAYKRAIQLLAKARIPSPLVGPSFGIEVTAVFSPPKCRAGGARRLRRVVKPDGDNVLKAVVDALTGVVWSDDALVSDQTIRKREAARGEEPHTLIRVRELPLSLSDPAH